MKTKLEKMIQDQFTGSLNYMAPVHITLEDWACTYEGEKLTCKTQIQRQQLVDVGAVEAETVIIRGFVPDAYLEKHKDNDTAILYKFVSLVHEYLVAAQENFASPFSDFNINLEKFDDGSYVKDLGEGCPFEFKLVLRKR